MNYFLTLTIFFFNFMLTLKVKIYIFADVIGEVLHSLKKMKTSLAPAMYGVL